MADGCPPNSVHECFERQAAQTPDAVAVVLGTERITYGQLNRRANQLAHRLMALGVVRESLVGICMERSVDLMVGLLGILKAGGAYVPLDPRYPRARLGFMIEDADVAVLLTHAGLMGLFPECRAPVICVDRDRAAVEGCCADNPYQGVTPSNLVYVMYTSGSTGQPKGVCIEHRGVMRLVIDPNFIHVGPDEVILQITSVSFDLSTFEIWGSLLNGGRLVLLPPDAQALREIGAVLVEHGVTTLSISSGLFHLMVDERLDDTRSVRQFLPAGEALSAPHVRKLLQHIPGAAVINGYGPTENTTYTTCYTATDPGMVGTTIPIGKPISGTTVHILDDQLRPVDPGTVGELYTGGAGLARGYLNRGELTTARFIRSPFADHPEERLYRTGDRARMLADGNIEYLGRVDSQVKIRGYRVELGEVETVLRQHPAVEQGVVLMRADARGEHRLTAYVVPSSRYRPAAADRAGADASTVEQWQRVYEETYSHTPAKAHEEFNTVGWNSSYTGQPIPEEDMREWVGGAVATILSLRPNRVIELGCGTGLLLYPIAPRCSEYVGTDFSREAIQQLDRRQHTDRAVPHLRLAHRAADDFEGLAPRSYDTLILNGVAQHFPSIGYFLRVLAGAVDVVGDGGHIFVGDNRSLRLLEAYQTSVVLHGSPEDLPKGELRRLVQRRLAQEEELVVDPGFYLALKHRFARITHVQIRPRAGRHHNELTKFRYDAIIHIGTGAIRTAEIRWLDWANDGLTVDALEALLGDSRPERLGVRSIPNARLTAEARTVQWLAGSDGPQTAGEWRTRLAAEGRDTGVEIQDLLEMAERLSYAAEVSWCRTDNAGAYDCVFWRRDRAGTTESDAWIDCQDVHAPSEWSRYTNQALREQDLRLVERDIRGFLESALPDYMLPAVFVFLGTLPLTPNGKLDAAALPDPPLRDPDSGTGPARPETPVQDLLSIIWRELLELDEVGTDEDFFQLGGHSLLAAQLMSRVEKAFQVDLPFHLFLGRPTIAGLAREITAARSGSGPVTPPPVRAYPRDTTAPLSFAQEGNLLRLQLAPTSPFLNVPEMLHYAGTLDLPVLQRTLDEFSRRHESARTTFSTTDGRPVQAIHPHLPITISVADLQHLPDEEREAEALRLANEETRKLFDLENGPLLRAFLIRVSDTDNRLLLVLHHHICDGYSIGQVLFPELIALYDAFSAGRPSPLPEPTVQYADYALWEREFLQDDVLEPHLSYWKRKLRDLVPLQLPYDYPRPGTPSFRTERHFLPIGGPLFPKLRAVSQSEGVTPFMLMLAAYQTLLLRNCSQSEIPVMTFAAGLQREEFRRVLGIFVNSLTMSTRLATDLEFRDLLRRVRSTALEAYGHLELPFSVLMRDVQPRLFAGEDRAFQAVFVYSSHTPIRDPKWSISWTEVCNGAAVRDLSLEMQEQPDGLEAFFQYRAELFKPETIARMAGEYVALLNAIAANPGARLAELARVRAE